MRALLAALSIYVLFLVQVNLGPWSPDLVLLALVVFAFHESRIVAALLGAFAGLCMDLTAPSFLGAYILVFTIAGYAAALLRTLFYRGRWSTPVLALAALALKWLVLASVNGAPPVLTPSVVSSCLTLLLSPIVSFLLTRLFYAQWNPGSTA
jgi:rod shape-determining protein MreD